MIFIHLSNATIKCTRTALCDLLISNSMNSLVVAESSSVNAPSFLKKFLFVERVAQVDLTTKFSSLRCPREIIKEYSFRK